jgi:hypothetical protein
MSQPTLKPTIGKRVNCQTHGHVPGFIICSCVQKFQKEVKHVVKPKENRLGEIMCARVSDHEKWEYNLICFLCAKERGFVQGDVPGVHPQRTVF